MNLKNLYTVFCKQCANFCVCRKLYPHDLCFDMDLVLIIFLLIWSSFQSCKESLEPTCLCVCRWSLDSILLTEGFTSSALVVGGIWVGLFALLSWSAPTWRCYVIHGFIHTLIALSSFTFLEVHFKAKWNQAPATCYLYLKKKTEKVSRHISQNPL